MGPVVPFAIALELWSMCNGILPAIFNRCRPWISLYREEKKRMKVWAQ